MFKIFLVESNLRILLQMNLTDFATNESFLSSSAGKPKHSAVIDVPIIVRNKAMPIFQEHYYSAVIDEDITLHSAVIQVQAVSPHGRDVIYSLFSGDEYNQFDINPHEGELVA